MSPDIGSGHLDRCDDQGRWTFRAGGRLCRVLGCRYPILQAGMGGVARSELVSAVTLAGGYGFLGMVREAPDLIAREIRAVRARTEGNFGVNLVPAATTPDLLQEQLNTCFEHEVHSICFFWEVCSEVVAQAKNAGCLVLYQVGSPEDALAAEEAGADVVIAQGMEAGGHVHGQLSSMVLLAEVCRDLSIPVVASGGFATGSGLAAALAMGAEGIHCGTVFLMTVESYAHHYHKLRILAAEPGDTIYTDAFVINWPAHSPVRVLENKVTVGLGNQLLGWEEGDVEREIVAEQDGRPIYMFSTDSPLRDTTGDIQSLPLYAGEISGLIDRVMTAENLVADIVSDASRILRTVNQSTEREDDPDALVVAGSRPGSV